MKRLMFGVIVVGLACPPAMAHSHPISLRDALNRNRAVAAFSGPPVTVTNTGSTNTAGYSVTIYPTGVASYRISRATGAAEGSQRARVLAALVKRFYRDLKAAGPLAQLPVNRAFKSVSFGTSTFVMYGDKQTPDLSSPADARGQALAADVKAITVALHLTNLPRHPVGPMTPVLPGH